MAIASSFNLCVLFKEVTDETESEIKQKIKKSSCLPQETRKSVTLN